MTTPRSDTDLARTQGATTQACGPRALCGWSPPALEADTSWKSRVDRFVLGTGAALIVIAAVIALLNIGPHLGRPAELTLDGVAALIAGGWCAVNFWRCRHAHCLVTGPGWLGLSAFFFAEAALGRSLIAGDEQLAFLGVLAASLLFECVWQSSHHTNAVAMRRGPGA